MGEGKYILWTRGTIQDKDTDRRHPWLFILGLIAFVIFVDLLLALALRGSAASEPLSIDTPAELRRILAAAYEDHDPNWIMIGDSVVAGDVLQSSSRDWYRHRIIDYLRSEMNPDFTDKFRQIGLNGLLPVDLLRIVRELDAVDPQGRVSILVEVNPRYFSGAYASQGDPTRLWLQELGPVTAQSSLGWMRQQYDFAASWVIGHLPIYRHVTSLKGIPHIDSLQELQDSPGSPEHETPTAQRPTDKTAAGFARVIEHYQNLQLGDDSDQVAALKEAVSLLRASGRRSLFFSTPLNDAFLNQAMNPRAYGDYIGRLSKWIDGDGQTSTELLNMDAPLFRPSDFVDHCHLLPDGNRKLAVNLLFAMGIGLGEVQPAQTLIPTMGPDQNLVWDVSLGDSNGSGWQARFNRPQGIGFDRESRWIVVADTMNHCLRELRGNHQTVRLLAGEPGTAGSVDGSAQVARLNQPTSILMDGERIWFVDDAGKRLRYLQDGIVRTATSKGDLKWTKIGRLRKYGGKIYLIDASARLLEYDPHTLDLRVAAVADAGLTLTAFDLTQTGALFVADSQGRIWRVNQLKEGLRIGESEPSCTLWFASRGEAVNPKEVEFPMPFDKVAFKGVKDIHWWETYGGLLVYNEEPVKQRPEFSLSMEEISSMVTERVHIRLLRETDHKVYPWLKTHAYSSYYWTNLYFAAEVSDLHRGEMAFDERSGSILQLELDRSRLLLYGDGFWGSAKEGNGKTERLGDVWPATSGAQAVSSQLQPQQNLPYRLERKPLKGPFIGLLVGSSMMATSDTFSQISCAREFEIYLRNVFEERDCTRFDLVVRTTYGLKAREIPELISTYLSSGIRPDVIFLDFFANSHQGLYEFAPVDLSGNPSGNLNKYLDTLEASIAPYDIKLVFLDNSAFYSQTSNGLRAPDSSVASILDHVEAAGYPVLRPGQMVMRDSLEKAPVGSPPYFFNWHASPWGIEANADALATCAYSVLSDYLKGRQPLFLQPEPEPAVPLDPTKMIGDVFHLDELPFRAVPTIEIPPSGVHKSYRENVFNVFFDAGRLKDFSETPEAMDLLIFNLLRENLAAYQVEGRALQVNIRVAKFNNYDEYGQGIREGATTLAERSYDRSTLEQFVRKMSSADQQPASPSVPQ